MLRLLENCSLCICVFFFSFRVSFIDYFFGDRNADLKPCISRIPEDGYGANITVWPERLHTPPGRLQTIQYDAYISRNELFKAESKYWNEIIDSYVRAFHWKTFRLRNVMDMKAGFGGYGYQPLFH